MYTYSQEGVCIVSVTTENSSCTVVNDCVALLNVIRWIPYVTDNIIYSVEEKKPTYYGRMLARTLD